MTTKESKTGWKKESFPKDSLTLLTMIDGDRTYQIEHGWSKVPRYLYLSIHDREDKTLSYISHFQDKNENFQRVFQSPQEIVDFADLLLEPLSPKYRQFGENIIEEVDRLWVKENSGIFRPTRKRVITDSMLRADKVGDMQCVYEFYMKNLGGNW